MKLALCCTLKKDTCIFVSGATGNDIYYVSGWVCMVNKLLFIGWFLCCTKAPFWWFCEQGLNASFMFAHMPKSKVINPEHTQIINTYWFVCWTDRLVVWFKFVQCLSPIQTSSLNSKLSLLVPQNSNNLECLFRTWKSLLSVMVLVAAFYAKSIGLWCWRKKDDSTNFFKYLMWLLEDLGVLAAISVLQSVMVVVIKKMFLFIYLKANDCCTFYCVLKMYAFTLP